MRRRCGDLDIDYAEKSSGHEKTSRKVNTLIDGTTGDVFAGQIKTKPSEVLQVMVDRH
jgi:hypothetical protein